MYPQNIPLAAVALASSVLVLTGLIKGCIGLGLAVVPISILSGILDPRFVLCLMIVPAIVTNLWQCSTADVGFKLTTYRFWPLIAMYMVFTWLGAQLLSLLDTEALIGWLGVIVILFCIAETVKQSVSIAARHEPHLNWFVGMFAVFLNGLTTVNGPPFVMYLMAIGLKKDKFIGAYGLIALSGAIPLMISYVQIGIFGIREAIWSVGALIPISIGLWLGEMLRRKIDAILFRKILLGALFLLGLNLVRRSWFI